MPNPNRILVTGATGKVGQTFIHHLLENQAFDRFVVRALCHHRELEGNERLEIVRGSIEQLQAVENALDGVSHVVHLATCKETPDQIMDVAVKGLFWLLEDMPLQPNVPAVHPDRRRCGRGSFRLPASDPGHRDAKAFSVPGLLCALESTGRSDAGAVCHPIQFEWLLPARAVDHGKGRFQISTLFRRGCIWRPALA